MSKLHTNSVTRYT